MRIVHFSARGHHHPMGQLVYAVRGVVSVTTPTETWVVPPNRAVWVPENVQHATKSHGTVKFRTLLIKTDGLHNLPTTCCVVGVSPFVQALILRFTECDAQRESATYVEHLTWLLMEELAAGRVRPLYLPFPTNPDLAELCNHLPTEPVWPVAAACSSVSELANAGLWTFNRQCGTRLRLSEPECVFCHVQTHYGPDSHALFRERRGWSR